MKKKRIFMISLIVVIVSIISITLFFLFVDKKATNNDTDAIKFSEEYNIDKDNVFVYRSLNSINKILTNGTGIVYLGFPKCPWCKGYVPYLNEVAKIENIDKIYYFNIYNDRLNNTKDYQKTVELLKDYLQYDEEGNKKIYVPVVIAVNKGKIVGFDDETAYDTKGYETPEEYWKNEDLEGLKSKLKEMFKKTNLDYCTDCNK